MSLPPEVKGQSSAVRKDHARLILVTVGGEWSTSRYPLVLALQPV